MSVVNPQLCKKLGIKVAVVQEGEGPIPHMHVYHGNIEDPKKCSYIRLDRAEYSSHHGASKSILKLLKKQKDALIEILHSYCSKQFHEAADGTLRKATGYEAAVDTWVDTYEEGDYSKFNLDDNGDLICPDYSRL